MNEPIKKTVLDFVDDTLIEVDENPSCKNNLNKRESEVSAQIEGIMKLPQRLSIPSPKELQIEINRYFDTVFIENIALYTFHTFLGLTEDDVKSSILTNDSLKKIYNFAIEKLKAKAERQMQICGRSTDAFIMQNIANWRKKDVEDKEESSGLSDFHDALTV